MSRTEGAERWKQLNEPLIAQFRAAGGRLKRKNPVLLLTTTGARTGRSITVPLNYTRDGDRLVVGARLHRLHPSEEGGQRLEGGPRQVVEWLLVGERPARRVAGDPQLKAAR